MKTIPTLAVVLALTACASPPLHKAGSTTQTANADHSSCLAQSGAGGYTSGIVQASNQNAIYESCMLGKGWSRETR